MSLVQFDHFELLRECVKTNEIQTLAEFGLDNIQLIYKAFEMACEENKESIVFWLADRVYPKQCEKNVFVLCIQNENANLLDFICSLSNPTFLQVQEAYAEASTKKDKELYAKILFYYTDIIPK